ncbi:hypothetical protein L910_2406 [Vibrio fluvialis PG41]|uniref:Uncharacterized protein n=1 Tax=Vibrio fluvialis PG41 TaxID=1336752 RepID=S7HX26_VIBFL|nr:hypothetical protein L910_2406 [Vibrio fluvialis PG41]
MGCNPNVCESHQQGSIPCTPTRILVIVTQIVESLIVDCDSLG